MWFSRFKNFEDKNVTILEEAQSHRILSRFFIERIFSQDLNITIIFKSSDSYNKSVLESQSFTSSQSSPQGGSKSDPGRFEGSSGIGSLPTCSYCKRKGHLISECFKLKRKSDLDKHQPLACAAVRSDQGTLVAFVLTLLKFRVQSPVLLIQPLLSQGFVSIDDSSKTHPVKILRNTGSAQTLLL